jgi:hypothetical protein
MANFQDRVIGALKLQPSTYDEVTADGNATAQAAVVVVAVSVASSLIFFRLGLPGVAVSITVWAVVAWAVSTAVIWLLATRAIPGRNTRVDFWQALRPIGFAQAPRLLLILAVVPHLGGLVSLVALVWTLAATVVAVKQAFAYDDIVKAIIVCVLAIAAYYVFLSLIQPGYVSYWY